LGDKDMEIGKNGLGITERNFGWQNYLQLNLLF